MCDNIEYLHDNETVIYTQTLENLLNIRAKYNKLKEKIFELKIKLQLLIKKECLYVKNVIIN